MDTLLLRLLPTGKVLWLPKEKSKVPKMTRLRVPSSTFSGLDLANWGFRDNARRPSHGASCISNRKFVSLVSISGKIASSLWKRYSWLSKFSLGSHVAIASIAKKLCPRASSIYYSAYEEWDTRIWLILRCALAQLEPGQKPLSQARLLQARLGPYRSGKKFVTTREVLQWVTTCFWKPPFLALTNTGCIGRSVTNWGKYSMLTIVKSVVIVGGKPQTSI